MLSHIGEKIFHLTLFVDLGTELTMVTDHCFELLNQSDMYHADRSLTTFQWHPEQERPMFNASVCGSQFTKSLARV